MGASVDTERHSLILKAALFSTFILIRHGPESLVDGFGGFSSCQVYLPVEEHHHEHRKKEGSQCRIEDVAQFLRELASDIAGQGHGEVLVLVVPTHQRRETNDEGEHPDGANQNLCSV